MDFYHCRWLDPIFLQNLHRTTSPDQVLMVHKLLHPSLFYGVLLALGLSYFWAQYLSASMFSFYHDWSGWRTITGGAPNAITHGLEKISWALIFCSSWWMLWKLDFLISQPPRTHSSGQEKQEENEEAQQEEATGQETDFTSRSENFVPEDDNMEEEPDNENSQSTNEQKAKKIIFPTIEELQMAEVLGLSKDDLSDFSKIKSTYRASIAQYHPDKVSALGVEIREVAEKKAKEINQAYEFFRAKFRDN
jgi:DnaJ-domain-containing protein 1